jgi:hypothetical protein
VAHAAAVVAVVFVAPTARAQSRATMISRNVTISDAMI